MFWRLESNQRRNAYETFLRTVSHQDRQDTKIYRFQIDTLGLNKDFAVCILLVKFLYVGKPFYCWRLIQTYNYREKSG
jgi:hypothetical protein